MMLVDGGQMTVPEESGRSPEHLPPRFVGTAPLMP